MTGTVVFFALLGAAILAVICYVVGYDHGSDTGRQIGMLQRDKEAREAGDHTQPSLHRFRSDA